jgi:hypothetical protein
MIRFSFLAFKTLILVAFIVAMGVFFSTCVGVVTCREYCERQGVDCEYFCPP